MPGRSAKIKNSRIAFLGGGRIASALLAGLHRSRCLRNFTVFDRNAHKLRRLARDFAIRPQSELAAAIHHADIILIAVRPRSVLSLLAEVGPLLKAKQRRPILVSLAAGIPLASMRRSLGASVAVARAMPSPASRSANGLAALCFARNCSRAQKHLIRQLFAAVGETILLPERLFDAFTAAFSVSHGYHALAHLFRAARRAGLPPKIARLAASHALIAGIAQLNSDSDSLEESLAEAATPGGIAAATMSAMDSAFYPRAVHRGIRAGIARARAIGRQAAQ